MVNIELVFEAYLLADNICIDKKWIADPIYHIFYMTIRNQSGQPLYFKLFNDIDNWGFGGSLPGTDDVALGAVGAGAILTYYIGMVRAIPEIDVVDSGNLTLKAYTDSGYSNLVASLDLPVTINVEDIESFTDVDVSNFDDGTSQGWSLSNLSPSNDKSVEAGGYSLKGSGGGTSVVRQASKDIDLPNRDRVRAAFFFCYKFWNNANEVHCYSVTDAEVLADDEKVFSIPVIESLCFMGSYPSGVTVERDWLKCVADLSAFSGLTKNIKVRLSTGSDHYALPTTLWIDRIVIAGED